MNEALQLKNWIIFAIQQSQEDNSEKYYYDRKNQEFFSVMVIDLFLFDHKMNVINNISPYYTKDDLKSLKDRLRRIKAKKSSVIELPKYDLIQNPSEIEEKINLFLTENKINLKESTLCGTFQKEPIPFEKQAVTIERKKSWWKVWK